LFEWYCSNPLIFGLVDTSKDQKSQDFHQKSNRNSKEPMKKFAMRQNLMKMRNHPVQQERNKVVGSDDGIT